MLASLQTVAEQTSGKCKVNLVGKDDDRQTWPAITLPELK